MDRCPWPQVLVALLLLLGASSPLAAAKGGQGPPLPSGAAQDPEENETANLTMVGAMTRIQTNWGTFEVGLYTNGAPITTENFIGLVSSGFYDGILFHRIVDDFVIQTGDPNTKDNNPYNDGSGGSGSTIPLETNPALTHIDGALGMARSQDPNSASSQFYVCDGEQHQLDGSYAVFGVVVSGMDVVRRIAQADVYGNKRPLLAQHPVDDIVMEVLEMMPLPQNDTLQGPTPEEERLSYVSVGLTATFYLGLVAIAALLTLPIALFVRARRIRAQRRARSSDHGALTTGAPGHG